MKHQSQGSFLSDAILMLGGVGLIALIIFAPFLVWSGIFHVWNWWAVSSGWNVVIPINWKSILTAVVISWFLRWIVCRKSS